MPLWQLHLDEMELVDQQRTHEQLHERTSLSAAATALAEPLGRCRLSLGL
jgi:hypothetical protein